MDKPTPDGSLTIQFSDPQFEQVTYYQADQPFELTSRTSPSGGYVEYRIRFFGDPERCIMFPADVIQCYELIENSKAYREAIKAWKEQPEPEQSIWPEREGLEPEPSSAAQPRHARGSRGGWLNR